MLVDGLGIGVGLTPESVQLAQLTVPDRGDLVVGPLPLLTGLGVGLLEQPVGLTLRLRRQVPGLLLGHPQDLLGPPTEVVEVGMGRLLRAGEVVTQLPVLGDQPLGLALQVAQPGLDRADEAVHGVAVVAAAVDGEVGGGER